MHTQYARVTKVLIETTGLQQQEDMCYTLGISGVSVLVEWLGRGVEELEC